MPGDAGNLRAIPGSPGERWSQSSKSIQALVSLSKTALRILGWIRSKDLLEALRVSKRSIVSEILEV